MEGFKPSVTSVCVVNGLWETCNWVHVGMSESLANNNSFSLEGFECERVKACFQLQIAFWIGVSAHGAFTVLRKRTNIGEDDDRSSIIAE